MRERAKLVKSQKERRRFTVSKRLGTDDAKDEEEMEDRPAGKRKKKSNDVPQMMSTQ